MGRINRRSYWIICIVLVAASAALAPFLARPIPVAAPLLAFVALPRLHDTGRSGLWLLVPMTAGLVAMSGLYLLGQEWLALYGLELGALPVLMLLGLVPGQPGSNRWGPPTRRSRFGAR